MATGILTVVGTVVGGPIGGMIGGVVGSIIDQRLFRQKTPTSGAEPTLDDIRISTASEGAGIPYFIGRRVRIAGTVIWMSENIIEKVIEQEVGGKGGPEEETVVVGYEYFVHMAVAWGTNEDADIQFIDKMWANGNLWYKRRIVDFELNFGGSMTALGLGFEGRLRSTTVGQDLTTVTLGVVVSVSGFPTAANNGTFMTTAKWTDENGDTILELSRTSGSFVTESDGSITVTQVKPEYREGSVKTLWFYTGTRETTDWTTFFTEPDGGQPGNPLLQNEEAEQSVFRELSYTVFEELAITPYGNQPMQMSAEIDSTGAVVPLSEAIKQVWRLAGRGDSEINTDLVDDDTGIFSDGFVGMPLVGPTSVREGLIPILIAASIRVREYGGTLHFITQGNETQVQVETADLGAYIAGSSATPLFRGFDPSPIRLPSRCEVTFLDPQKDYQRAPAIDRGFVHGSAGNVLTAQIPVAMAHSEAKKVARQLLWNTVTQRRQCKFFLGPKHLELAVGDIARVFVPRSNDPDETSAENYRVLVEEIERGADLTMQVIGFIEDSGPATIKGDTDASDDAVPPEGDISEGSFAYLTVADIPPLVDSTVNQPGFIWAVVLAERATQFRGAVIYESANDQDYSSIATASFEAKLGFAKTALPSGRLNGIDEENSLDVVIFDGELAGISEAILLQGQTNIALIGDELLLFRNATLLAEGVYRISGFIRGLRNTEDERSTHVANERFLLLEQTRIGFVPFNLSDRGTTRYYRAVPAGGLLADALTRELLREARTSIPFSPSAFRKERLNTGSTGEDHEFTWIRRSRRVRNWWDWTNGALDEGAEVYEIDVYSDNTFATLLATKSVTITPFGTIPNYTYTEADQNSDGHTPGDPFNLEVFQVSPASGRSKALRVIDL